jgi:putative peptidoglycan lipid II flippase
MQLLYLVLPISALLLVLRIPFVRLAFGAPAFDWDATVLTGRTLSYLAISIFASALVPLVYRAFYALHNTFIPLIVGTFSTILMVSLSAVFILIYHSGLQEISYPYSFFNDTFRGELVFSFGVEGIAFAYSIGNIMNLLILLVLLRKKIGKLQGRMFLLPLAKIFTATVLTAVALYIPLKLLDQLVFDTSRIAGLIILTGISGAIGLSLYLFLTWLFDVKEARAYLAIIKKIGNWKEILGISDEVIDANRVNP